MNENVIMKEEMTMIVFFTANLFLLLLLTFFTVMNQQGIDYTKVIIYNQPSFRNIFFPKPTFNKCYVVAHIYKLHYVKFPDYNYMISPAIFCLYIESIFHKNLKPNKDVCNIMCSVRIF